MSETPALDSGTGGFPVAQAIEEITADVDLTDAEAKKAEFVARMAAGRAAKAARMAAGVKSETKTKKRRKSKRRAKNAAKAKTRGPKPEAAAVAPLAEPAVLAPSPAQNTKLKAAEAEAEVSAEDAAKAAHRARMAKIRQELEANNTAREEAQERKRRELEDDDDFALGQKLRRTGLR